MFIEHANFLKKLRFPRICLPGPWWLANCFAKFYHLIFSLFTFFLLISWQFSCSPYLALFPLWFCWFAFLTGLGQWLAGECSTFSFSGDVARPSGINCHVLVLADADRLFSHHLGRRGRSH